MGRNTFRYFAVAFAVLMLYAVPLLAQTGRVVGQVTGEGGAPLSSVQVQLAGTAFGAITGENGRYVISGVPPGTYAVEARRIGLAPIREDNVRVGAGETVVNFVMSTAVLKLQKQVITGVIDPTSGVRSPISVETVDAPEVPPASGSPVSSIQGKVAGAKAVRTEGKPGSDVSVQLRTPASINKSTEPLYVVDGIVLGASTVDISGLDIESMEIVKGAAAASIYGSRAANGVIQIRTKRGTDLPVDRTTITARSEYGRNSMARMPRMNRSHAFLQNAAGQFVDTAGAVIPEDNRAARVQDPIHIYDNRFTGRTYNHLDEFFRPGRFNSNTVTLGHNTAATNFMASLQTERETGTVEFNDGFSAMSGRLNVDHRLTEKLNVSVSGYHRRSRSDEERAQDLDRGATAGLSANPFYDILFFPADVNLRAPNANGEPFIIKPDPKSLQENPLYNLANIDAETRRQRTMGGLQARYSPWNWLTFEGNAGYDQSNRTFSFLEPKNMLELNGSVSPGRFDQTQGQSTAINGQFGTTALLSTGRWTTRTTGRLLASREREEFFTSSARNLTVEQVPDLDAGASHEGTGATEEVRSNGMLLHVGTDYAGKYIADGLIRRDGSSLFGPAQRYHTYYRVSGAYRVAQEPWWPTPQLTEFKLRASRGTAGGRPEFEDRFETWVVDPGGITKLTLGNEALKPELATENEIGVDMIALGRYGLSLTYAYNRITDQLIAIPQKGVTGYSERWENAGTVEGRTFEMTLDAQIMNRGDMQWNVGFVLDRNRNRITEFNSNCYRSNYGTGTAGQILGYRCAGVTLGTMYGERLIRNVNELPAGARDRASEFQRNDDGLLVWVGPGNTYQEGLSKSLWNQASATIGGTTYRFGRPIKLRTTAGADSFMVIGDGNPKFSWGMTQNFQWKGFSLYALLSAQVGGNVYNHTKQWSYRDGFSGDQDQAGKPDGRKKTIEYYADLYNTDATIDWFVEDGSFVKLREMSLKYDFTKLTLPGFDRIGFSGMSVGLIGRNLKTWTSYSGFDPEVGSPINRLDDFGYPPFRTLTGFIELKY